MDYALTPPASIDATLRLVEQLIAFAVFLQSIELLVLRDTFSDDGVWAWETVREEFAKLPVLARSLLDGVLSHRGFLVLLALRVIVSALLLVWFHPALVVFLWMSTLLITVRWRGTFNGGSDYMTLIVLLALGVSRCFGGQDERWGQGALTYIAVQVGLSYFVAGFAKVQKPQWRNGKALAGFLTSNYYAVPQWIQKRTRSRSVQPFAWILIAFECLWPFSVLNPTLCLVMIGIAVVFQLLNAYVFGLNRFVWAWAAAYPAFYWLSTDLARRFS